MTAFHKVATKSQVSPGQGKSIELEGKTLALFNVEGEFFATDNTCPHAGGQLGEGTLDDNTIICPLHGWRFDVKSGKSLMVPGMRIKTYPVKVEGENILISLEETLPEQSQ